MEKRGGKEIDATPMEKKKEYTVVFKPDSKEVLVSEEATLLDAALTGNILLNASCNGNGSCGKCKLVLESGTGKRDDTPLLTRQEKEQKSVLACQAIIQSDVIVRILEETIEKKLKIAGMGKEITARMQGLVRGISPMHCFCLIQIWMIFPV
jgi:uncharacterized 2Fe-2S/4Fe-4S cluster protein (DUF4445 family)